MERGKELGDGLITILYLLGHCFEHGYHNTVKISMK